MISERKIFWYLLVAVFIFGILLLLSSCSTEKKAQRKVAWLLSKDLMDDNCARLFPVKDSLITKDSIAFDTLYVESDPELIRDTILKGDTVLVYQKCPPQKVITKTIYRDSIHYRTNTAEEDRLKGEIVAKDKQIKAKDDIIIKQQQNIDKDNWWKVAAILTWCIVFTGLLFRFFVIKKPI